jgi:hypothetical protein
VTAWNAIILEHELVVIFPRGQAITSLRTEYVLPVDWLSVGVTAPRVAALVGVFTGSKNQAEWLMCEPE